MRRRLARSSCLVATWTLLLVIVALTTSHAPFAASAPVPSLQRHGRQLSSAADLLVGLSFDGSTLESALENDATGGAAVTISPALSGGAQVCTGCDSASNSLHLDGTGALVVTDSDDVDVHAGSPSLTVAVWLHPSSSSPNEWAIVGRYAQASGGDDDDEPRWELSVGASDKIDVVMHRATYKSSGKLMDDEWTHVAVVATVSSSDAEIWLYIGGTLDGTVDRNQGFLSASGDGARLIMGARPDDGAFEAGLVGCMDDLVIYSAELGAVAVSSLVGSITPLPGGEDGVCLGEPSPSPSVTGEATPTASLTRTSTITSTPTATTTASQSSTDSASRSLTPSSTASTTSTRSASLTGTTTQTSSASLSSTQTSSMSPSISSSRTGSATATATSSASASPSPSSSPSSSPSTSGSHSETSTSSATASSTASRSVSITAAASASGSVTATTSASASGTAPPTRSASVSRGASSSRTPTATASVSASSSMSSSTTQSPSVSSSLTRTSTASSSRTQSPSASISASLSSSASSSTTQSPSSSSSTSLSPSVSISTSLSPSGSSSISLSPSSSSSLTHTLTASSSTSQSPSGSTSMTPSSTASGTYTQSSSLSPSVSLAPSGSISTSLSPSGSPSVSLSSSGTNSVSLSPTATRSSTQSPSGSSSASLSSTASGTHTQSPSASPSVSQSPSGSISASLSSTASGTHTQSPSASPSVSQSPSGSISASLSSTASGTHTQSPSASPSVSQSPSGSISASLSSTASGTHTQPPSASQSVSQSPSGSISASLSSTASGTHTQSLSGSPSVSPSPSGSNSASLSPSASGTHTQSLSSSPSTSPSPSGSISMSLSPTASISIGSSPSGSASLTLSSTATVSGSESAAPTPSTSETSSRSATPTTSAASTNSPSVTRTGTSAATPSSSVSASGSSSPGPSSSPSALATASATTSVTGSATVSASPSATGTGSPSRTVSVASQSTAPSTTSTASRSATGSVAASVTAAASTSAAVQASQSATASTLPTTSESASRSLAASPSGATRSSSGSPTATSTASALVIATVSASRPPRPPSTSVSATAATSVTASFTRTATHSETASSSVSTTETASASIAPSLSLPAPSGSATPSRGIPATFSPSPPATLTLRIEAAAFATVNGYTVVRVQLSLAVAAPVGNECGQFSDETLAALGDAYRCTVHSGNTVLAFFGPGSSLRNGSYVSLRSEVVYTVSSGGASVVVDTTAAMIVSAPDNLPPPPVAVVSGPSHLTRTCDTDAEDAWVSSSSSGDIVAYEWRVGTHTLGNGSSALVADLLAAFDAADANVQLQLVLRVSDRFGRTDAASFPVFLCVSCGVGLAIHTDDDSGLGSFVASDAIRLKAVVQLSSCNASAGEGQYAWTLPVRSAFADAAAVVDTRSDMLELPPRWLLPDACVEIAVQANFSAGSADATQRVCTAAAVVIADIAGGNRMAPRTTALVLSGAASIDTFTGTGDLLEYEWTCTVLAGATAVGDYCDAVLATNASVTIDLSSLPDTADDIVLAVRLRAAVPMWSANDSAVVTITFPGSPPQPPLDVELTRHPANRATRKRPLFPTNRAHRFRVDVALADDACEPSLQWTVQPAIERLIPVVDRLPAYLTIPGSVLSPSTAYTVSVNVSACGATGFASVALETEVGIVAGAVSVRTAYETDHFAAFSVAMTAWRSSPGDTVRYVLSYYFDPPAGMQPTVFDSTRRSLSLTTSARQVLFVPKLRYHCRGTIRVTAIGDSGSRAVVERPIPLAAESMCAGGNRTLSTYAAYVATVVDRSLASNDLAKALQLSAVAFDAMNEESASTSTIDDGSDRRVMTTSECSSAWCRAPWGRCASHGTCACLSGWSGTYCNVTACVGVDGCGSGECLTSVGACACGTGAGGEYCSIAASEESARADARRQLAALALTVLERVSQDPFYAASKRFERVVSNVTGLVLWSPSDATPEALRLSNFLIGSAARAPVYAESVQEFDLADLVDAYVGVYGHLVQSLTGVQQQRRRRLLSHAEVTEAQRLVIQTTKLAEERIANGTARLLADDVPGESQTWHGTHMSVYGRRANPIDSLAVQLSDRVDISAGWFWQMWLKYMADPDELLTVIAMHSDADAMLLASLDLGHVGDGDTVNVLGTAVLDATTFGVLRASGEWLGYNGNVAMDLAVAIGDAGCGALFSDDECTASVPAGGELCSTLSCPPHSHCVVDANGSGNATCLCDAGYVPVARRESYALQLWRQWTEHADAFRGICVPGCANNCSGHGECRDGQCVCRHGYDGVDCRFRVQCAVLSPQASVWSTSNCTHYVAPDGRQRCTCCSDEYSSVSAYPLLLAVNGSSTADVDVPLAYGVLVAGVYVLVPALLLLLSVVVRLWALHATPLPAEDASSVWDWIIDHHVALCTVVFSGRKAERRRRRALTRAQSWSALSLSLVTAALVAMLLRMHLSGGVYWLAVAAVASAASFLVRYIHVTTFWRNPQSRHATGVGGGDEYSECTGDYSPQSVVSAMTASSFFPATSTHASSVSGDDSPSTFRDHPQPSARSDVTSSEMAVETFVAPASDEDDAADVDLRTYRSGYTTPDASARGSRRFHQPAQAAMAPDSVRETPGRSPRSPWPAAIIPGVVEDAELGNVNVSRVDGASSRSSLFRTPPPSSRPPHRPPLDAPPAVTAHTPPPSSRAAHRPSAAVDPLETPPGSARNPQQWAETPYDVPYDAGLLSVRSTSAARRSGVEAPFNSAASTSRYPTASLPSQGRIVSGRSALGVDADVDVDADADDHFAEYVQRAERMRRAAPETIDVGSMPFADTPRLTARTCDDLTDDVSVRSGPFSERDDQRMLRLSVPRAMANPTLSPGSRRSTSSARLQPLAYALSSGRSSRQTTELGAAFQHDGHDSGDGTHAGTYSSSCGGLTRGHTPTMSASLAQGIVVGAHRRRRIPTLGTLALVLCAAATALVAVYADSPLATALIGAYGVGVLALLYVRSTRHRWRHARAAARTSATACSAVNTAERGGARWRSRMVIVARAAAWIVLGLGHLACLTSTMLLIGHNSDSAAVRWQVWVPAMLLGVVVDLVFFELAFLYATARVVLRHVRRGSIAPSNEPSTQPIVQVDLPPLDFTRLPQLWRAATQQ